MQYYASDSLGLFFLRKWKYHFVFVSIMPRTSNTLSSCSCNSYFAFSFNPSILHTLIFQIWTYLLLVLIFLILCLLYSCSTFPTSFDCSLLFLIPCLHLNRCSFKACPLLLHWFCCYQPHIWLNFRTRMMMSSIQNTVCMQRHYKVCFEAVTTRSGILNPTYPNRKSSLNNL